MKNGINSARDEEDTVRCPFCDSGNTEVMSIFGQQLLTVQFYCNHCKSPFGKVRDSTVLRRLEKAHVVDG